MPARTSRGPLRRPSQPVNQGKLAEELKVAQSSGTGARVELLMRLVDRLVAGGTRFNDYQLSSFDEVIASLLNIVEPPTRAAAARKLAKCKVRLSVTMGWLARDHIEAAYPMLVGIGLLNEQELEFVARTKGDRHLYAIANRSHVSEQISSVLVQRGDVKTLRRLASNRNAKMSNSTLKILVEKAGLDEQLAAIVGLREDLAPDVLETLLWDTTDRVRNQLIINSPPDVRDLIETTLARIYRELEVSSSDYHDMQNIERKMQKNGTPEEKGIAAYAANGQRLHLAVSICVRASAELDMVSRILAGPRSDLVLIVCRCAQLSWDTVETILLNRRGKTASALAGIAAAHREYQLLDLDIARRTLESISTSRATTSVPGQPP